MPAEPRPDLRLALEQLLEQKQAIEACSRRYVGEPAMERAARLSDMPWSSNMPWPATNGLYSSQLERTLATTAAPTSPTGEYRRTTGRSGSSLFGVTHALRWRRFQASR